MLLAVVVVVLQLALLLDGANDYLSIPTSTEFGFGTGAWTIEFYFRPASVTGTQVLVDLRSTATELAPLIRTDGTGLEYHVNGTDVITGGTIAVNTWYHLTVSKSGSTTKMFLNGVQVGSDWSDSSDYGSTKPVRIGADYQALTGFTGHIDELRISNSARHTAAFTPIPYKVFSISAGAFDINFLTFVVASILGRGLRFYGITVVLWYFGRPVKKIIDKYFDLLAILLLLISIISYIIIVYIF